MPQPEWDALTGEVRDLQARVSRLEYELGLVRPPASQPASSSPQAAVAEVLESPTALLPLLGRALLGLAGAYLLRALTESATIPRGFGVGVGLFYAMLWLVLAARTPAAQRMATALHGLTGALVISPLLFEATSRFHTIAPWTAGLLLFAFTVFGFAVSWRKDLLIVATFATLAGLGTAGALLIVTRDVVPFTFVFLAIAAAVEICACLNHWLSERWLAATAADLAVLLITWLVTNERGVPPGYAPISFSWLLAAQIALLAIYLSSTIFRTLLRGFTVTWFETAQCAVAFVIAVGTSRGPTLAVLCLLCSAACYFVAFRLLDHESKHSRNFYTYSTFAILLVLAGSWMLLSGAPVAIAWGILAVAGAALPRLTLQVHGGIYLLLGLAVSGAFQQAVGLLLGARAWPAGDPWTVWLGAAIAVACCWIGAQGSGWLAATLRTVKAASAVLLTAGLAAGLLTFGYHTVFGVEATHAYCATLRTAVIVAAALLLARFGRLGPLIYPLMILGAWRLVTVDLQQEHKAALFLSLLLYGAALMLLPRVVRRVSPTASGS